jgi:hypothetical protein
MGLTQEKKDEIKATLTANAGTWAAKRTWAGVDLVECEDDELLAFNELLETLAPVEQDISCPCGRKHVFNHAKKDFEVRGMPKQQRGPTSFKEFYAAGGGTPEEREAYDFNINNARNHKQVLLEQLTANMSDKDREGAWKFYESMPIPKLEEAVRWHGCAQTQNQQAGMPDPYSRFGGGMGGAAGAFGQQGQPGPGGLPVANEQVLEVMALKFEPPGRRKAE